MRSPLRARVVLAGCVLAAAAGLPPARPARGAEPVKLLKSDQYEKRVVAPKRGRVLVVNFWATWCEPCREEMPALVRATAGVPSKDLAVVLVSIDSQKTGPTAVPKFLATAKIPFVCWLLKAHDPQPFIDSVDRSWDGSLPFTVIYGRDGKPVAKLAGQQTEKSFSDAIRKALSS